MFYNQLSRKHDTSYPYIKLTKSLEARAVRNILDELYVINKSLLKLPYEAQYLFYSLFTTNRISIFKEYFCEPFEIFEAIQYVKSKYVEKGPSKENLVTLVLTDMLNKLVSNKYGSQTFLRTIIEDSFEEKFNIFYRENSEAEEEKLSDKLMLCRRAVMTPSRIVLEYPFLSLPNRAIRTHKNLNQNFLRVSFQTDEFNRGYYMNDDDPVLMHIQKKMTTGFRIGSKTPKFLHYSNSQMKSHSCWFMHESEELTYKDFMETIGKFDKNTTVSKNASRKGQAFSSTIKAITLDLDTEIKEIPDVERNGYNFSDGCGLIDQELLNKITYETYNHPV